MERVTYARLLEVIGLPGLRDLLATADGVATVNWTMTLGMTEIWRRLAVEVLPGLRKDRPLWFVDLADPAKRTAADMRAALDALVQLQTQVDVVLGMNGAECRQVLEALGERWPDATLEWEAARVGCATVQRRLGVAWAMCHLVRSAACAWKKDGGGSVGVDGFFEAKPLITTGAGDHFNAGFLTSLLSEMDPAHSLIIGGATSGFYVRSGISPSRDETIGFLRSFA
jgi:sugar/nucleoside kinase (ribokinase family)